MTALAINRKNVIKRYDLTRWLGKILQNRAPVSLENCQSINVILVNG